MTDECQIDVLLVGAGPTGLALAGSLAKAGVRVRVIDKNATRSDKSKALAIQAGTLESIEQVYGPEVVRTLISTGLPTNQAYIHINNKSPIPLNLRSIPSQYNYILMIPQNETERILEEQLQHYSVSVDRQQELISLTETSSKVICTIKHQDESIEQVVARYVVGCDGAHSTVRHSLDISFEGDAYTGNFILGDVKIQWPLEYGVIRIFMSAKGIMACFPMKGEQRYRIIMIPKSLVATNNSDLTLNEFQNITSMLSKESIEVSDPVWLTRFSVHHRIAASFRKGHVFLAGDAAHIHSPVGGQGMNIGIQDALNLAYKLDRILHEKAPESLLDNYEKERIPVARKVLRDTHSAFKLMLLQENFLSKCFRSLFLPLILRLRWIQFLLILVMSEIPFASKEILLRSSDKSQS